MEGRWLRSRSARRTSFSGRAEKRTCSSAPSLPPGPVPQPMTCGSKAASPRPCGSPTGASLPAGQTHESCRILQEGPRSIRILAPRLTGSDSPVACESERKRGRPVSHRPGNPSPSTRVTTSPKSGSARPGSVDTPASSEPRVEEPDCTNSQESRDAEDGEDFLPAYGRHAGRTRRLCFAIAALCVGTRRNPGTWTSNRHPDRHRRIQAREFASDKS